MAPAPWTTSVSSWRSPAGCGPSLRPRRSAGIRAGGSGSPRGRVPPVGRSGPQPRGSARLGPARPGPACPIPARARGAARRARRRGVPRVEAMGAGWGGAAALLPSASS